MRGLWAQSVAVLLFGTLLLGLPADSTVLVMVLAGILLVVGVCRPRLVRQVAPTGPAKTVYDRLRALARRGVPRLRDPDAAGHTRSRAPSGLLPAG